MKRAEAAKVAAWTGIYGGLTFLMGTYMPHFIQEDIDTQAVRAAIVPCSQEYRNESRTLSDLPEACIPVADYVPFAATTDYNNGQDLPTLREDGVPAADTYTLPPKDEFPSTSAIIHEIGENEAEQESDNNILRIGITTFGVVVGALYGWSEVRRARHKKNKETKEQE